MTQSAPSAAQAEQLALPLGAVYYAIWTYIDTTWACVDVAKGEEGREGRRKFWTKYTGREVVCLPLEPPEER